MIEFVCNSLGDTKRAAKYFSQFAKVGRSFALSGDLGSGKTTFSKYLIGSIDASIKNVSSPTFAIIQTYDSKVAAIWHIDCYRLQSMEEFFELGLEEAFLNCITIIEWPEIIRDLLPVNAIKIKFTIKNGIRKIETVLKF